MRSIIRIFDIEYHGWVRFAKRSYSPYDRKIYIYSIERDPQNYNFHPLHRDLDMTAFIDQVGDRAYLKNGGHYREDNKPYIVRFHKK